LIVVVAILVRPLWRQEQTRARGEPENSTLAILREQLAELEREQQAGTLSAEEFSQAYQELQRRLLDEMPATESAASATSVPPTGRHRTAIVLMLLLPLLASLGYALLGNPRALDPLQRQARLSPQQIENMVAGLVDKLRRNPDDSQGWLMLARSYKVLGKFPEAVDAYGHVSALVDQDAALLADYAEVISQAQGGSLLGKPGELIERALKLDGNAPQALLLAGAAARERRQFAAAAEYWSRLLAQLEPGTTEAETLSAAIAQARQLAAAGRSADKTTPAANALSVGGEVSLSGKLAGRAQPGDVLFVFARAEDGARMPLSALRATVAELPLRFRLDDTMALPGGRKLSEFKSVSVEARVTKAGAAQSSSGDLFGRLAGVKPGRDDLRLVIDQVQP
ncbi:MAG TPA: c-type cytochrome biogenesis protein CcmI, partial [Accumulibacter sp.]|nr:c-type cytochrome biogenesis protein CcmI [Accumulibacter sp.]